MMIDHSTPKLQAALYYASLGWKVFPLRPLGKEPLFPLSWTQIATTDEQTIRFWWVVNPDANIAVVCGGKLCVFDADRKEGKPDGWAEIADRVDLNTPWTYTPHSGYHFYYRDPGTRVNNGPGIDVQQGNHYVVAPPSTLPDGSYVWGNFPSPECQPSPVPFDLLLKYCKPQASQTPQAPKSDIPELTDQHPSWQDVWSRLKISHTWYLHDGTVYEFHTRSELLHSLVRRLYKIGLTDAQVLSLLWSNTWVQDLALDPRHNHQRSETRALNYLWESCRKLRHHRTPSVTEVFKPLQPQQKEQEPSGFKTLEEQAKQFKDQASKLNPGEDVHVLLRGLAASTLGPVEKDEVLNTLKRQGFTKLPLQQQLRVYESEVATLNQPAGLNWVHTVGEEERPLGTIQNLEVLLAIKKATIRYNEMDHRIYLTVDGRPVGTRDLFNVQLSLVRSWAAEHRLPIDVVPEQLSVLAHQNAFHPFKTFVERAPWDGRNRVHQVMETVQVPENKKWLRRILMEKWFVSVVAAVYGYENRAPRGVLTFIGKQGIGKTTWLKYLVPAGMYHQGHVLRADNKDSATKGLRYLLVELGELGSTFKKSEIEQLKNYIGQHEDVYRLPYARDEVHWPRQTIFAASANNQQLLHDQTGNTRWWVLPTSSFDLNTMERWWGDGDGYELQQFWAEVRLMYERGDAWDLTDQELAALTEHQESHLYESAIVAAIKDTYQWETVQPKGGYTVPRRLTDIARDIGLSRPFTNTEMTEVRPLLQRLTGQEEGRFRRINIATIDGRRVDSTWRDEMREQCEQGTSAVGRWWYLPRKQGNFAPVEDSE